MLEMLIKNIEKMKKEKEKKKKEKMSNLNRLFFSLTIAIEINCIDYYDCDYNI
jgi:hypothetical protein